MYCLVNNHEIQRSQLNKSSIEVEALEIHQRFSLHSVFCFYLNPNFTFTFSARMQTLVFGIHRLCVSRA